MARYLGNMNKDPKSHPHEEYSQDSVWPESGSWEINKMLEPEAGHTAGWSRSYSSEQIE